MWTINFVTVYVGLLELPWKTVWDHFIHVQRTGGEKHTVISCQFSSPESICRAKTPRTHLLIHLWCCRNSWGLQAGTDPQGREGGREEEREGERQAGIVPGLPGILCRAHFAHSLRTADLDCCFFQLLFQVIPSLLLLLIFFKAGLCTPWSQLQFHLSFCLIISGNPVCSLTMHQVWASSPFW